MELVGADRKLLKAFYTQYTAVLLIILTFNIGAFQRTIDSNQRKSVTVVWTPRKPAGSLALKDIFTREGAISPTNSQLRAVAEVLTQHDLIARITLGVTDLGIEEGSSGLRRAQVRLQALKNYFVSNGVPSDAFVLTTKIDKNNPEQVTVELLHSEESS